MRGVTSRSRRDFRLHHFPFSTYQTRMLSHASLRDAFERRTLFAEKVWRLSPEPWPLTPAQHAEIHAIGRACLAFQQSLERLYERSWQGKKILRNRDLLAPWVARTLDYGKPAGLVAHARHRRVKGEVPVVLRPDLLLTDTGFALTELDSVPGGVGLTSFLNTLYGKDAPDTLGGDGSMPEKFYRAVAGCARGAENPVIAIVVSDEAATYRPEFEWLAETLRESGRRVYCTKPEDLMPTDDAVLIPVEGVPEKIDVIYRFFELFDLANVKGSDAIFDAVEAGRVAITPPMKAHQEEKLNLALLHHPALDAYWKENLSPEDLATMRRIVPKSWLMEPAGELPPTAVLHAPLLEGRPIRDWTELADATQKERNLVIKASGFHETAWGARSVTLGSDVSRDGWLDAIEEAVAPEAECRYVMQEYRKPERLAHPVYNDAGELGEAFGRVRLCPYFFVVNGVAELAGALATFCPADKKIIHGMKDAALLPCRVKA